MPLDSYTARTTRARYSAPRSRFFFSGVGDREVRVVASDGGVDRYGDILVPSGCRLENFRRNPICLAQHDATMPIARVTEITADSDAVLATITFPDAGVNALSDQYLKLLKSRVVNAVSVGFLSIARVPLASGSWKYLEWELIELSVVSIPALPSALVVERGLSAHRLARDLERARQIAARQPWSRERNLEKAERIRVRLGLPAPVSPAERYAAEQEVMRRDRAAAGDAVLRMQTLW